MHFMNVIDTTIKYHSTEPISNMNADKIYQILNTCICVYNHSGHTVTEIRCDQKDSTIMGTMKDDLVLHMNHTAYIEHEPVSDHNNRTV